MKRKIPETKKNGHGTEERREKWFMSYPTLQSSRKDTSVACPIIKDYSIRILYLRGRGEVAVLSGVGRLTSGIAISSDVVIEELSFVILRLYRVCICGYITVLISK